MSYKGDYIPPSLPPKSSCFAQCVGPALMIIGALLMLLSLAIPAEETTKEPVVIEKVK